MSVTKHGPTSTAVTPRRRPFSSKTCVVPSLRPRIPSMLMALELDLDVHAARQLQPHERVHRLGSRLHDVDEPLVGADFELLARILVDVRALEHAVLVDRCRERHRARHRCTRPLRGLHDLPGRLVEQAVVVCLQLDANLLASHMLSLFVELSAPSYAVILVTTPAPTVRPPSRMA